MSFQELKECYAQIEELQSQLAQTQEKLSEFESNYLDPKSYLNKLEEELSAARELVGRLSEALEFYADVNSWMITDYECDKIRSSDLECLKPGSSDPDDYIAGKRARAALKEIVEKPIIRSGYMSSESLCPSCSNGISHCSCILEVEGGENG